MTSLVFISAVVFAACSSAGGGAGSSGGASAARQARRAGHRPPPRVRPVVPRPPTGTSASPIAGGLLDKVLKAKKLVVSTDPNYAPQSFLKSDGSFEGFDIDVATEIAKRLGVEVKFETPGLGHDHRRLVGRPLGHQRRLDDDHRSRARPSSISALRTTSRRPRWPPRPRPGSRPSTVWPARRSASGRRRPTRTGWRQAPERVARSRARRHRPGVKVQTLDTDQACAQAIAAGRKDAEGS